MQYVLILIALLTPALASAAVATTFAGLVGFFISLINPVVSVLGSIALLLFFWGIVRYIYAADNSEAHKQGREMIVWGVIALFVLFSVWGLARVLVNTFLGGGAFIR